MSSVATDSLPKWVNFGLIPFLNLATAFIVSGLVIWSLGEDPFLAMSLLLEGAFGYGEAVSYTFYYSTHFLHHVCDGLHHLKPMIDHHVFRYVHQNQLFQVS